MLFTPGAIYNYKILCYVYATVALATLVTNISMLAVFVKLRYYKTRHHKFLITLTITDLLSSCTVEPMISYDFLLLSRGYNDCNISNMTRMLGSTLCFMSITTIILINGEQYVTIVHPYHHIHCPAWLLFGAMSFTWMIFITISTLSTFVYPATLFTIFKVGFSAIVVMVFFIMCFAQVRINKEISIMAVKNRNSGGVSCRVNRTKQNRLLVRTSRMAKSILLLFGFCFAPLVIISISQMITSSDSNAFCSSYYRTWCYFVLYLNSLLDPFVYCARLKTVRKFFVDVFRFKRSNTVATAAMSRRARNSAVTPAVAIHGILSVKHSSVISTTTDG